MIDWKTLHSFLLTDCQILVLFLWTNWQELGGIFFFNVTDFQISQFFFLPITDWQNVTVFYCDILEKIFRFIHNWLINFRIFSDNPLMSFTFCHPGPIGKFCDIFHVLIGNFSAFFLAIDKRKSQVFHVLIDKFCCFFRWDNVKFCIYLPTTECWILRYCTVPKVSTPLANIKF